MQRYLDIAVLSPTPSHPQNYGNRKRVHALCTALRQRGARIHFLLYPLEHDWGVAIPEPALAAMRDAWDEFYIIPPSVPIMPASIGLDHTIDEWWDPSLGHFLSWYCARRPLDALLVNYVYLSRGLLHAQPNCLKVLDTHDRVSRRRERLAEIGIPPEWFHTTDEEEATGILRADLVLAIKPEEQAYFESLGGPPVLTVAHSEERHLPAEPRENSDGYLRIGILGARNNINVQTVTRFLQVAIPRFRDFMAPIKIVLAGSMCQHLEQLRQFECVEMIGPIKDIRTFYETVDVVVGPVNQSSGQKIRIAEALTFGLPIVSHAHSFEGYQPSHPWHRLDGLQAIADACIDLSFDRTRLTALCEASQESYRHLQENTSAAVDCLADRIARSKPADLFVVDVAKLGQNPLLARHIVAMVGIAATYSKVLMLLKGAPNEDCLPLVAMIRNFARIWATEQAAPPVELERIENAASAAEILNRFHVGNIWLFGTDSLAEMARKNYTIVTAHAVTEDMPVEADAGYGPQAAGTARFGRLIARHGVTVLSVEGAVSIPYFHRLVREHLIGGAVLSGRSEVAISVSPASIGFAVSLAAALAVQGESAILLIAPDGLTASKIRELVDRAPILRRRALVFDLNAAGLYERGIKLVVDLAAGIPAFALLKEYAIHLGVPVLLPAASAEASGATHLGESSGLRFMLQAVKAACDPAYREELLGELRRQRDDGANVKALSDRLAESATWVI